MHKGSLNLIFAVLLTIAAGGCGEPDQNGSQPANADPTKSSSVTTPAPASPSMSAAPAGTQSSSPNPPGDDVAKTSAAQSTTPAPESAMTREEFMKKMQQKLEGLQADILALEKKVQSGTEGLRAQYENVWKPELIKKRDEAQALLNKAKETTEAGWDRMKVDIQSALDDLRRVYDETVHDLKTGI